MDVTIEQSQLLKKCKEPPKFSGLICKAKECDKAMTLSNGKFTSTWRKMFIFVLQRGI